MEKPFKFIARCRCDWEEYYCVDEFEFFMETCSVVEAAIHAETVFCHHTLMEIKRVD